MVVKLHGEWTNVSAIMRATGLSRRKAKRYLGDGQDCNALRLLNALPFNFPEDMFRHPRVYLRPRLFARHYREDQKNLDTNLRAPSQSLFAARMTEEVIARESFRYHSHYFVMGRYFHRGVDLVVCRGNRRIGFLFEPDAGLDDLRELGEVINEGWIDCAILVRRSWGGDVHMGGKLITLSAKQLCRLYFECTRVTPGQTLKRMLLRFYKKIFSDYALHMVDDELPEDRLILRILRANKAAEAAGSTTRPP